MEQSIQERLQNYTPSPEAVTLLRDTQLVLVVGVTGAGKNTILNAMVETGHFYDLVTTVTREPRYNNGILEQDGMDYHFITNEQALVLMEEGKYLEASPVHGRVYGVTVDEIVRAKEQGKTAIADVDVQGVSKFKKLSDNVTAIFLVPPSYDEWLTRVRKRYQSDEAFMEDWPNRRSSAIQELEKALSAPYYHFVVNDELSIALDACIKIAHSSDRFVRKDDEVRLVVRDLLDNIIKETGE